MPEVNLSENLRCCIRADGSVEPLNGPQSMDQIRAMIGAPDSLDVVHLRKFGLVMCVDDTGKRTGRPANAEATRHYHSVCKPGTTYTIAGDVVIVPDADFAP
jgi:predicted methyltransferase